MLKNLLPKSAYIRNILTLMTGTSLSQAILISISPILTRIYTPEDFGVFAVYGSIVGIIGVIACGRFELAIMIPPKDEDAKGILFLSISISVVLSIVLLLIAFLLNDHITRWLNEPLISPWLYFVPLSVLLLGTYNSLNYWFNREKRFKDMAFNRLAQTSTNAAVNLSVGALTSGPSGLIGGQISGQAFGALFYIFKFLKIDSYRKMERTSMKEVLKTYSDFPKKGSISIIFNLLANQLPVLFIGALYGGVILGFYALVMRILNTPLWVIGKAVSQVFYQTSSQNVKDGKSNNSLFVGTSARLLGVIVLPMIILFFWGGDIFSFVFGAEWREAGELAKLFVFYYLVRFIFSAQSTLLIVRRKLGMEAVFNIVLFAVQMGSLYLGYITGGYYYSFFYMAISGFIMYLAMGILLYKLSKNA